MSPLIFAPMPLPRHAGPLFWGTLAFMIAVAVVFDRYDLPRSVSLCMGLGYLVGLFAGHGEVGGLVGVLTGIALSLAYAKVSARKR